MNDVKRRKFLDGFCSRRIYGRPFKRSKIRVLCFNPTVPSTPGEYRVTSCKGIYFKERV